MPCVSLCLEIPIQLQLFWQLLWFVIIVTLDWVGFEAQLQRCSQACSKLSGLCCNLISVNSIPLCCFPIHLNGRSKMPKNAHCNSDLDRQYHQGLQCMGLSGQEWFFCPVRGYFNLTSLCFETVRYFDVSLLWDFWDCERLFWDPAFSPHFPISTPLSHNPLPSALSIKHLHFVKYFLSHF